MKIKSSTIVIVVAIISCIALSIKLSTSTSTDKAIVNNPKNKISIIDDLGRTISIEKPAKRIVSTYSANTETLVWMGAKDLIVGTSNRDSVALNVAGVGSHIRPDIEAILACRPDLVIISASRKSALEKLLPFLNENNIPIVALYPRSVEKVFQNIKKLSTLTGRKVDKKILPQMQESLSTIKSKVANIPLDKRKKVFFEVNSLKLLTCGSDSVVYNLLTTAGAIPLSKAAVTVHAFDTERLIASEPDYYLQQKGAMNKNPIAPNKREIIKDMNCIKNGNWSVIDEALVSRPGPKAIKAVETIFNLLYPNN